MAKNACPRTDEIYGQKLRGLFSASVLAFFPDSLILLGQLLQFSVGQVLNVNHLVLGLID